MNCLLFNKYKINKNVKLDEKLVERYIKNEFEAKKDYYLKKYLKGKLCLR